MKTAEQLAEEIDGWIPQLEEVTLSDEEFDALLEYSTTIPTGVTVGKQWKRQLYYGKYRSEWVRAEYVPDKEDPENYVGIDWVKIKKKEA